MANRYFNQFRLSLEKQPVDLFMTVTIGATGAPTLVASKSKGISSIVRNSVGKYTITLMDKYVDLLIAEWSFQNATGISAAPEMGLVSYAVSAATPTIVIQFANNAGAATDPANGDEIKLNFTLKNSTAY
jgi:hypothetical protein